jgi:hypothetical protein
MERNSVSGAGVRIAAGTVVAVSMLLGCSDGGSSKKKVPVTPLEFIRGDSNNDGIIDLADGIYTNNYLFLAGPPPVCEDAADSDDNGLLDLIDSVFSWNHLFRGGPTIPEPFPDLGLDDTADDLTCESYVLAAASTVEEELEPEPE